LLALHVVTANLGLGQVAGIAVLASASQGPTLPNFSDRTSVTRTRPAMRRRAAAERRLALR